MAVSEFIERNRSLIFTGIQYLLGLVALAWVIRQVRWSRTLDLLANIGPWLLLLILAVSVAAMVSKFYSLHVLHNRLRPTPFSAAMNVDLSVLFINHLLPSRLAGRSATPLVVKQFTDIGWGGSVAIAGVHTAYYALLYGIIGIIGLLLAFSILPVGLALIILLSIGLYLGVGAILMLAGRRMTLLDAIVHRVSRWLGRVPLVGGGMSDIFTKIPAYTGESESDFRRLTEDPMIWITYTSGWLGSMVVFPAIRVWLLLSVFGEQGTISLVLLPFFLVMAYSVTLLPLTPGGIGIAEASATLVFASLGIPVSIMAPTIVIDRFLGAYLPSLFGWIPISRIDLDLLSD